MVGIPGLLIGPVAHALTKGLPSRSQPPITTRPTFSLHRTAVLGTNRGDLLVVDCRAKGPGALSEDGHAKKINTVHFDPGDEHVRGGAGGPCLCLAMREVLCGGVGPPHREPSTSYPLRPLPAPLLSTPGAGLCHILHRHLCQSVGRAAPGPDPKTRRGGRTPFQLPGSALCARRCGGTGVEVMGAFYGVVGGPVLSASPTCQNLSRF